MANKKVDLTRVFSSDTPSIPKLLLHFFGTNPYYAMAKKVAGEITYQPIQQSLSEELIQQHLDGTIILGSYHLNKDNTVNWLGWDVDSGNRDTARSYAAKVIEKIKDIPHAVEFSGSKGYHILIFLSRPMPADKAKQIVEFVRDSQGLPKAGTSHIECYPKQASLGKNLPMGNLLKIPLGIHPRSHDRSKFVNPENGWEAGEDVHPETLLTNLVDPDTLAGLLKDTGEPHKMIVEKMIPFWSTGERHNIALYLAAYMAHLGWGMQETCELVKDIAIASGDSDVHNRITAAEDTFRSIKSGKSVKGFSGLNEMLPGAVVREIANLAAKVITPKLVNQIDGIRLQKMLSFEKIRQAASMIWTDLQERGKLYKTQYDETYWYSSDTHLLIGLLSVRWSAMLHKEYGINPAESFGIQVTEAIRLKAINEAETVTIQNRTYWTGEELLVNLGSARVYRLTGTEIEDCWNGECGYLFKTDAFPGEYITEPDFGGSIDVWEKLTNDLSFSTSTNAPATPQEQRELLKAWILAFFFQELMPTKPLLLALGVPGSGKTTAMRRILKVLESPDADVLEIAGDKPDSLRASIASHKLLVIDNLEKSGVRWLVDTLNRLATGANIELRQLYKTNEMYLLKPNCFVAMTAVSMPFSEETLFSRILPLELQQLKSPMPEYLLQKMLKDNMNGLWGDILLKLNQVVATLKRDRSNVPPIASRLADFTVFCKRIEKSGVVNGAVLIHGLQSLVERQKSIMRESSPFCTVLDQWLNTQDEEVHKVHTFSELFSILEPLARMRKLTWRWSNAGALTRHVLAMEEALRREYHAEIDTMLDANSQREIATIKFN
jgi:hypothetical protein